MLITRKDAEHIVEIIWKHFDVDQNGYLDPAEAKDLFEFLCSMNDTKYSKETLEHLFEAIDANNDDKITREEVINLLTSKI